MTAIKTAWRTQVETLALEEMWEDNLREMIVGSVNSRLCLILFYIFHRMLFQIRTLFYIVPNLSLTDYKTHTDPDPVLFVDGASNCTDKNTETTFLQQPDYS